MQCTISKRRNTQVDQIGDIASHPQRLDSWRRGVCSVRHISKQHGGVLSHTRVAGITAAEGPSLSLPRTGTLQLGAHHWHYTLRFPRRKHALHACSLTAVACLG